MTFKFLSRSNVFGQYNFILRITPYFEKLNKGLYPYSNRYETIKLVIEQLFITLLVIQNCFWIFVQ